MVSRYQYEYVSPLGSLFVVFDDQYLYGVHYELSHDEKQSLRKLKKKNEHEVLMKVVDQLDQYFKGTLKVFDLPIVFDRGTDFQKSVWKALEKVAYGKVVSYKDIAVAIENPKAVRAVGGANNKNPISIIIP